MIPLQNLFYYIRDLYNFADVCFDFQKDKVNPKTKNLNYWEIINFLNLANQLSNLKTTNFSLAINNDLSPFDYLLKVKRFTIPEEPILPNEIENWIKIDRLSDFPNIIINEKIEIFEKFEDSKQRIEEYEFYKNHVENSLFSNEIPNSLIDWIELKGNEISLKKENIVTKELSDLPTINKIVFDFKKEFTEYYKLNGFKLKSNEIYDALHTLYYELKSKETKKLFLSFGLVCGKIGNEFYKNFLFHVPLKLSFKNQELKIEIDTFSNKIFCEQFFTELLENHFSKENPQVIEVIKNDVLVSVDNFNSNPHDFLFDNDFIRTEYYDKGLEVLNIFTKKQFAFFQGENLNYNFIDEPIENQITFSFSPIIQTKIVESKLAVSKDASNIINKINELEANNNLNQIPDFFKKLFNVEGQEIEIQDNDDINFKENKYQSLFPLPYNDEQFEIAKQLNLQDALTVKGPPGTGKSHTIANLISHFVAQGKSILVVSHNSKALSVLRDKLPEEIKELAVSLVNEGNGNENLKASVDAIIRNLNQSYKESKVIELENELNELEKLYSNTLEQIYDLLQKNNVSFKIYNPISKLAESKTANDWAIFLKTQNDIEAKIILDFLSYDLDTNDLIDNIYDLLEIGKNITAEDYNLINYTFIDDSIFLSSNELRKFKLKIEDLYETTKLIDYSEIDINLINDNIISSISKLEEIYILLKENDFIKQVLSHNNFNLSVLKNILFQNSILKDKIDIYNKKLIAYELNLSSIKDIDSDILLKQINQLILKFGDSKKLNWFTKSTLDKSLKRFFECKLNFNPIEDLDQLKILELEINRLSCLKQLNITFKNYLNRLEITTNKPIDIILQHLELSLEIAIKIPEITKSLNFTKSGELNIFAEEFNDKLNFLKKLIKYSELNKSSEYLEKQKVKIISHNNAHPIIYKIAESIGDLNLGNYELYLNEYKLFREKHLECKRFESVYTVIANNFSNTASFLKDRILNDKSFNIDKSILEKDIFFSKIKSFLNDVITVTNGAVELLSHIQILKFDIEKKTSEIVAYKTWYHKSKKINLTQKSALSAWKNDLIKIGKGYGKNTNRNLASAIKNMQIAKDAVPIWIMKQDNAITFFPNSSPKQFDLLIIDEASQCDISSLNLIFRASKSLVVGDENQTSVVADRSLFTIERTNELLDKYLVSHKFKTQFDITNSIYTISGVIYPNIVTLREHFRCLPEIIGYSNKYVYNNDIIPLKTATDNTLGNPIEIYYIEDNIEDDFKPNIVTKVIQEIEKFIIAFKENKINKLPTIGILSLDSSNKNHQFQLFRQISQSDLIKEYEDSLDLLVGTSREFQGDERDVIFMTITASHSISEKDKRFEIKPPRAATTEEYMRIFNVAASRAKEKSVLIHSIHPDAIGIMNEDCYRKKLIDYYTNIKNQTENNNSNRNLQSLLNKTDSNSGDFEKTVCTLLYNNGFGNYIEPQYKVGKYIIDFAVIINRKKLAIECDGFTYHSNIVKIQEDIKRQLILERAGWKFFRIQSTDWFYKNEKVSAELINWINDNK